ncbi:MAG: hypothetical protein H7Z16_18855 [Pyrinomonadaceae bacterium]|nr:hypothetical protein [Pyrinomonadaceae bacterium]
MDRVRIIIGYEWRAYWRRFSRAGLRSNQGIILFLSVLIAFKYLLLLRTTAVDVANGNSRLLVQLLTAIFLVWLFPLAASGRDTLGSRKWLHLPLSLRERFMVRAISLLIPPSAWLVLVGSFAILYPLAHAHNSGAGIVAGLLFIAIAWLTGLTISHLLNSSAWRIFCWAAALAVLSVGGVYLIKDGEPQALLSFTFSPAMLVARAATRNWGSVGALGDGGAATATWFSPLTSLTTLATLAFVAGLAALWSFKKSLAGVSEAGGSRTPIVSLTLAGRLGGLVAKDFRYFRRLLDAYLGVAAAVLACLYLTLADEASRGILLSFIVVVFLCNAALAFNNFGLDNRSGLDRYALLPLNGRAILLSKNLAYLMIVGVQLFPILVLAGWRLGLTASAFGLVEAAALAFAYLAWGNWMSINHPLKMQFFRFANSGAALVDEMGGMIFGSLAGILIIYLLHRQGAEAGGGIALILLVTGALYFVSVARFGGRLAQKRERIAEALS